MNPRMLESESNALPLGDTPLYWASLTPMHVYIAPATLWKLRPQNAHGAFGGTRTPDPRLRRAMLYPAELQTHAFIGAGDGNRTHTASLEGWNSTIELHPRKIRQPAPQFFCLQILSYKKEIVKRYGHIIEKYSYFSSRNFIAPISGEFVLREEADLSLIKKCASMISAIAPTTPAATGVFIQSP